MSLTPTADDAVPANDFPGAHAHAWWTELQRDNGARAELRRCHDLDEVVFTPAFHRLRARLGANARVERVALVAWALAQVERDAHAPDGRLAQQFVGPDHAHPIVSDLRFRRVLTVRTHDELAQHMVRLLRQIDRAADVRRLARALWWFLDGGEDQREKKQWALDYYALVLAP